MSVHNANAFYELAIQHAVQLPAIHMIRSDWAIPFDVAPFRAIRFSIQKYEDLEEAQKAPRDAVAEVQKTDFQVENPASSGSRVSPILSGEPQAQYGLSNTANRSVRRPAIQARFFLGRRWPSGIPSARAFCLREPGVRLSAVEMVLTRVLSLECCLSSFTSARVQSRRAIRFLLAIVLAMTFSSFVRRL
jgi:hypothetical protein